MESGADHQLSSSEQIVSRCEHFPPVLGLPRFTGALSWYAASQARHPPALPAPAPRFCEPKVGEEGEEGGEGGGGWGGGKV